MCKFSHKQNTIHIGAMTTLSMLAELTIRNARLLTRTASIRMIVFELPTYLNQVCMCIFFCDNHGV